MISKLPVDVYQRIKAGEVIEDPSSVVRELLDNALDAKATQIVIEVESSGFETIIIKDNGEGMTIPDLEICFLEHTTSKIQAFEDIATLQTNGFRGEALASICRVAHVNILSATADQKTSEKIWIEQGTIQKKTQLAHRKGTMIEVKDLFYNLPVRKSFLRSKTRELSKIKKEILQKAMAFPDITFQLLSEKKTLLMCMPQSPKDRLLALTRVKNPIHALEFENGGFRIEGYVTGIDQVFDSSAELFLFLNRRPFQAKEIFGVMKRALSQLIPKHKYLGGYLYITTTPSNIDPNIHPAKKELKLYNEETLLRGLYVSLQSIFYRSSYQTFLDLQQAPSASPTPSLSSPDHRYSNLSAPSTLSEPFSKPDVFPQNENKSHEISPTSSSSQQPPEQVIKTPSYRYIGVYQGTYWIVEKDQNIVLIDFHAAHERMRYEDLKKQLLERSIEIQPLLTPEILSLSEKAWDSLEKSKDFWVNIGFDIDLLGDFKLLIRAVPNILGENPTQALVEFLEQKGEGNITSLPDIRDRWLKFAACRKSYMANDHVPQSEIAPLLEAIFQNRFPLTCPHGRPFTFTMPYQTIVGHFLR